MKTTTGQVLVVLFCLLGLGNSQAAPRSVVATLPDFGAIAQAVGGEHIKLTTLARGTEDPHFVDARPSFVRVLNRADLLLHGGAELEIGWLPSLVQNARNSRILPGQTGNVSMAHGIELMDVPQGPVDRSQGDVHMAGNPHYWLDPANGVRMAEHLAQVFGTSDPEHAERYQLSSDEFTRQLRSRIEDWKKRAAPLRGVRVITYHKSFEYLARWLGLEIVGQLEPKPGIEPSPAHISHLISSAKTLEVRLILIEPFRPRRTAESVAQALNARVVLLPDKTGATDTVKDYLALFDTIIQTLLNAAR